MADTGKRIIKGASYFFIFSILAAIAGYGLRFILARNLSVEDFGLFYAVFSFVLFFSLFKDLGMGSALAKFVAEYKAKKQFDHVKSLFVYISGMQLISVLLFALVIFFLRGFLAENYFHEARAVSLLVVILGWFILITIQDAILFMFYGLQNFLIYSMRDFLKSFMPLIFVLLFLFFGFNYLSPAYSYLFASICIIIVLLPILLKQFNFSKHKLVVPKPLMKKIFAFSIPVMLTTVGGMIMGYTDTIFLTLFRSLKEVGIYNVVLPTTLLFLIFGKSIAQVMFPISSELWAKKKKKEMGIYMGLMYKYVYLVAMPFALTLIIFSDLFLKFFFGPEYLPGSLALKILLIGSLVYSVADVNNTTMAGIGKPKIVTQIILAGAVLNIILNLLLIPLYGITGAALASAISYVLVFVFGLWKTTKTISIKIPFWNWLKILFSGGIFVLVSLLLRQVLFLNPWLELIVFSTISFLVYLILVLLLKVISIKEIKTLVKSILTK